MWYDVSSWTLDSTDIGLYLASEQFQQSHTESSNIVASKMPWWGRTKQDSKKKHTNLFDGGQPRKYHPKPRVSEEDGSSRASRYSVDVVSEAGSGSGVGSRSPSPSSPSKHSQGQPLPLPCAPPLKKVIERTYSGSQLAPYQHQTQPTLNHAPSMPLPSPTQVQARSAEGTPEVEYASGSVSSVSSLGSVDVVDPWQPGRVSNLRPTQEVEPPEPLRPATSQMGQASTTPRRRNTRQEHSRSPSPLPGSHPPATSPTRRVWSPLWQGEGVLPPPLNIPQVDSSMSSPAPSPRSFLAAQRSLEPAVSGSASPRSVATSAYNSSQGDPALWPQQHIEERSPVPSPRLRSPGPSRNASATVSPLHPRAGARGTVGGPDSPTTWHEEGRVQHPPQPLPLPPVPVSNSSPYTSPSISSAQPTPTMLSRHSSRAIEQPASGTPTKWQKGKLLGSGTFGNVYVGFNNDSGGFCAMKEVLLVSDDHKSKESVRQLGQEISLLSKLRHENIVQYIGTETLEDRLYIYLEYVSGGSIHKLLQEYGAFKEPVIRNYTRQILSGLAYLHNQNTVHRDVKGANILVDTNGMVKLADFGMAKHITAQSFLQSFKGSPYWMAPEVIKHTGGYDLAVDIWSLGCTVLEMVTTKPPWHQYEGVAAMFKIGNSKELPAIPDSLSREGQEFVRLCLQRSPAHRPTAAQLLEHPFVQDAPRVASCDDPLSNSDLLPSTTSGIRSLNVSSSTGQRQISSQDNDGSYPIQARGRLMYSPTSELSPRGHVPSALQPLSSQIQPRASHQVYSGMSTPMMSSGCSTPQGGIYGSSPHLQNQVYGALSAFPSDCYGNASRTHSGRYASSSVMNGAGGYQEPRKEFQWSTPPQRTPDGSPRRRNYSHVDNILDLALGRMTQEEDSQTQYQGNGTLGEHLSQHLYRRPVPGSSQQSPPMLSHTNSHEFGPC